MKEPAITCPICQTSAIGIDNSRVYTVKCESKTCGTYCIALDLGSSLEFSGGHPDWDLTPVQRAVVAHEKYLWEQSPASNSGKGYSYLFKIEEARLAQIRERGRLPSRAVQATNLIRFVGEAVSRSGDDLNELPENIHAIIGSVSFESARQLTIELVNRGSFTSAPPTFGSPVYSINLKLEGWERYDAEQRGQFYGDYGFLAMQFDDKLDEFVQHVVKPTVKKATGYELVDLRDVSRAGIIDNLMVTTIRDARFVIADLTHDNRGAYWEAGYAEGLGKPVVYICSKEKFNDGKGTHFDTNHYTTVQWSTDDVDSFGQELTATLRRSLANST